MAPVAGPAVHHYVAAARPVTSNLYGPRLCLDAAARAATVARVELGLPADALDVTATN